MSDEKYVYTIEQEFSLQELSRGIEDILRRNDMKTNKEFISDNRCIITATNVSGNGNKFIRNVSGTVFSLTVYLEVIDNELNLYFKDQSWRDKAAGYALSIWLWPLLFTATYGSVRQVSVERQILDYVNDVFNEKMRLEDMNIRRRIICATPLISLIIFLTMGFGFKMWGWGALAFLLIPLMPFILGEVGLDYIFPLVVCIIYVGLGFGLNLWHPAWIIFLTIPVYYIIFPVKKVGWKKYKY